MKIRLITPTPPSLTDGNSVTAARWASLMRELGHQARVQRSYDGSPCDLLIALNAVDSFDSLQAFRDQYPDRPTVVALTGTDVYRDLPRHRRAINGLRHATRLVVLQERAMRSLPRALRSRTHIIYQAADPPTKPPPRASRHFQVCVMGHLRDVKDPFRTALAARQLPDDSRTQVLHIGKALTRHMEQRAQAESKRNSRYRWVGEQPRSRARRMLAASHLLALTSRLEGSSNVLTEALASGIPVIATRIPGLVGTLGSDYPGYFRVGDTQGLARLLHRAETDRSFYRRLTQASRRVSAKAKPSRERTAWRKLMRELAQT